MSFYLRLAALALLLPAIPATAQTLYVTSDRTVANSNPITGVTEDVVVGRDAANTNFFGVNADITGDIAAGGLSKSLYGYNNSNLKIISGTIGGGSTGTVLCYDSTTLTILGGSFGVIDTFNSSIATISAGNISNTIYSNDQSTINLSGSVTSSQIISQDQSMINVSGGTFTNVGAQGTNSVLNFGSTATTTSMFGDQFGHVNVTGGVITKNFVAIANSTATISGGDFGSATTGLNNIYGVVASQNSVIDFGGSAVTRILEANANGVINVTGGTIGEIKVGAPNFSMTNSAINLYGGDISPNTIRAYGDGILNVYGINLALSGAIGSGSEDGSGNYTEYLLTGTLQNGQVLNTRYRDFAGGLSVGNPSLGTGNVRFFAPVAAPEPGTLVYLGVVGILGFMHRTRRQR